MSSETLQNFGERALIHRIKDIVADHGGHELTLDDSALVSNFSGDQQVWVTIDPCPMPNLVQRLGMGDYYHAGWLCVLKSISDLAAMGATPSGVLVAVDFPVDLAIENFDRFFKGVVECALAHETNLIGGNIKEGGKGGAEREHAVSCGIGNIETNRALMRGRTKPGDLLFVVDREDFGGYWAGIAGNIHSDLCSSLQDEELREIRRMALTPKAKVKQAQTLLAETPPSFCMDNSDGMIASAFDIVKYGDVDVVFSIGENMFPALIRKVAKACNCDARTWAFGWGSYNLLCAADKSIVANAEIALNAQKSEIVVVGEVITGNGQVCISLDNKVFPMNTSPSIRGEQFVQDSFWEKGAEAFTSDMLGKSLNDLLLFG